MENRAETARPSTVASPAPRQTRAGLPYPGIATAVHPGRVSARRGGGPVAVSCLAALVALGTSACGSTATPESATPEPANLARTAEYREGVEADVYLPPELEPGPAPVVVLVPGGSWASADRTGLGPLADALAADGMVAVNATYRAAGDGVVYPVPVEDIACAVSWAAEQAGKEGVVPDPLVVAGHSAGAQLSALAALAPDEYAGDCPAPPSAPTGFVGLAGPYDLTAMEDVAQPLFGVSRAEDPESWRDADVGRRAAERPELDVLLLHGEDDTMVSPASSQVLASAMSDAGHDVTLTLVPGVDHLGLFAADAAAPLIAEWVAGRR